MLENNCEALIAVKTVFFPACQKAVVVEELMFKLQDEDSAAAAPLFAEAAVLPQLERSTASFYKPLRVEQSNNRAVKTYIPVFFPFIFILALFFYAIY